MYVRGGQMGKRADSRRWGVLFCYLPVCLPTCQLSSTSTFLPACQSTFLPICLPIYLPIWRSTKIMYQDP